MARRLLNEQRVILQIQEHELKPNLFWLLKVSAVAITVGPFALPTQWVMLLICIAVAGMVAHLVGRRQLSGISALLADMLLAAVIAARIAFVVVWFDNYRNAPWTILDIRDGGFTPWAGALAAIVVALWQGWRRAALRGPLLAGILAGTLVWTVWPTVLGLNNGPTLSALEDASLITLQGTPQSIASLAHNRPLVVNLWATWCPPCRREMPVLAAAQQQAPGVSFIFVNQGENAVAVTKYLTASQLVLANVLLDPEKTLGQLLGSTALPTTLFFDAKGRLVDTHLGALSSASLASKMSKIEAYDSSGSRAMVR